MLSPKGSPAMDDLTGILSILQNKLEFAIEVKPSTRNRRMKQTA